MTTLTIEIADSETTAVSEFIKQRGGNIISIEADDDLTQAEFDLLQESYREILSIKNGEAKALSITELWNE